MNRIYDTGEVNGGHGTMLDERSSAHDVDPLGGVKPTIALNKRLKGLKHSLPRIALSAYARDQIAHLVDHVFLFPNSVAPAVVAFSNVDVGAGSSEMCLHVGNLLADRVSGNVCVVDANGKRSLLCRLLATNGLRGLSDAMDTTDGLKDFVVQLAGGNLWLLPAGSAEADPLRASPDRLRARITELRKHFDYILIDAPAVTVASTILLGQAADGMVVVVEAHRTRRDSARIAKEILDAAHISLLGAVLNNRTFPIPEVIYRKL